MKNKNSKEKNKYTFQNKLYYVIDIVLVIFALARYYFYPLQIGFSTEGVNVLVLGFTIIWFFVRLISIFKENKITLKIINIVITCFLFITIGRGVFCEFVTNAVFPEFIRDIYAFPNSTSERFVVTSNIEIIPTATTIVYYEKTLFPGITCKTVIDTFSEEIHMDTNTEYTFKFYEEYFKSQNLNLNYDKYIEYINNQEDKGFCNFDITTMNSQKEIHYYIK